MGSLIVQKSKVLKFEAFDVWRGRRCNMKKLIEIGKIVNTHGLKGEVKIIPWLDYPEIFDMFSKVYTSIDKAYKVKNVRYQKSNIIAKLEGIDDIESAEKIKNSVLYAEKSLFDNLPEGTYLIADIIGLSVYEGETFYGKVKDVFSTGSNDVYVVENEEKQILLPIIPDVLQKVDIEGGRIDVKIPLGLLDI